MTLFGYTISEFLAIDLFGEFTIEELLIAAGCFVGLVILFRIFRTILLKRFEYLAKKTTSDLDDKLVEIVENITPLFYWFLALYITTKVSPIINGDFEKFFDGAFIIFAVYEVVKISQNMFGYGIEKWNQAEHKHLTPTTLHAIKLLIGIIIWSLGLLLVLSNLGFDISALLVGGGIGGIAIALAAQNILGDLFSSFSIYFDRPFGVGDFIVVGTDKGVVKKIGLKTTRIQTLLGEELVISNKELTNARVQNFKRMKRRRISFSFGVIYETDNKKLKKIPEMLQKIIDKPELAECDRVHFHTFGDSALIFDVVYYINSSDYVDYMNTQQGINFDIRDKFEKEGIEMAYPTQTVYVKK